MSALAAGPAARAVAGHTCARAPSSGSHRLTSQSRRGVLCMRWLHSSRADSGALLASPCGSLCGAKCRARPAVSELCAARTRVRKKNEGPRCAVSVCPGCVFANAREADMSVGGICEPVLLRPLCRRSVGLAVACDPRMWRGAPTGPYIQTTPVRWPLHA